jgi:hypothetical protein
MAVPPVSSQNSARNRLVHSTRSVDFAGLHGETCYILVVDHHTGYYLGDPRVSKASPINWLHRYMETHSPSCAEAGSSGKVYAFTRRRMPRTTALAEHRRRCIQVYVQVPDLWSLRRGHTIFRGDAGGTGKEQLDSDSETKLKQ